MKFEDLDLSDDLLDALYDMHFDECTPIQEQAIPLALQGRDLIAVAQTGTGKTAAYLLPVIDMITYGDYPTDSINCVVMSPTRELAQQIDRQMEGFAYYMPVSSIAVYGGAGGEEFSRQQHGLKTGADVVIATPGRLLAHLQTGMVDLSKVSFFILDEADRMLDMGFYDDIMQIVKHLPAERQTLMFSATMPPKIKMMAKAILRDPAEVKIAVSRPADKIEQSAYICNEAQKPALLEYLLRHVRTSRVIVFASSKLSVKDLSRSLRRKGLKLGEMHSDLEQQQRDEVMLDFKAGRIDALIATDIVARGIDIEDISMVVNYDVPRTAEDYVHRVGRTARANAGGMAVTLVAGGREQQKFGSIERFLEKEILKNPLPEGMGEAPAYRPDGGGRHGGRRDGGRGGNKGGNRSRSGEKPSKNGKSSNSPKSPNSPRAGKPSDAKRPEKPANAPVAAPAADSRPAKRRDNRHRHPRSGNNSAPKADKGE